MSGLPLAGAEVGGQRAEGRGRSRKFVTESTERQSEGTEGNTWTGDRSQETGDVLVVLN